MLRVGTRTPTAAYLGGSPVERAYLGTQQVWARPGMTFTFDTSEQSEVVIPLSGRVDVTIDWGDSSPVEQWTGDDPSHDYGQAGVWQVKVAGTASRLGESNLVTGPLIGQELVGWTRTLAGMTAYGGTGLEALSGGTGFETWSAWANCTLLTSLDVSGWDVSAVTNLTYAWYDCTSLTSLDVSGWDVSAVTSLFYAWANCTSLTSLDVSGWDVSQVTTASNMLSGVTLDTASYDAILTGWGAQDVQPDVTFHGGNSQYTEAGEAGRQALLDAGWTITDGGPA